MSIFQAESVSEREVKYINFPSIDHGTLRGDEPVLNRWSSRLTKDHDFPGAQVSISREAFTG